MNQSPTSLAAQERIQSCQRFLRVMTGIILGAFAIIILMTTVSAGPLVQTSGKVLYYVIVLAAFSSLGVWLYRVWMEKQTGR
ncbi:MAG: hypothetical protein IT369_14360 [Candidatus Latescibacteria bacterium]|nr:hypothetical protein [Candidatus Latescibacterota bacterium]